MNKKIEIPQGFGPGSMSSGMMATLGHSTEKTMIELVLHIFMVLLLLDFLI